MPRTIQEFFGSSNGGSKKRSTAAIVDDDDEPAKKLPAKAADSKRKPVDKSAYFAKGSKNAKNEELDEPAINEPKASTKRETASPKKSPKKAASKNDKKADSKPTKKKQDYDSDLDFDMSDGGLDDDDDDFDLGNDVVDLSSEDEDDVVMFSDDDEVRPSKSKAKKSAKVPEKSLPPRKRQKIVVLDSDDEGVDEDAEEVAPPTPKKQTGKSETKTPAKSPARKPAAKRSLPPAVEDGESATAILSQIPDAELPDTTDAKPFNFYAHKQAMEAKQGEVTNVSLPEAQPDCFLGMTFVFTGTMPSLSREYAEGYVKRYGGKVTGSISGKTSVVVVGDEAGPKKIERIKELGVKAIDQDGFVELVKHMPAGGGSGERALKAREKAAEEAERTKAEAAAMAERLSSQPRTTIKSEANRSGVKQEARIRDPIDPSSQLWTTRYAPQSMEDVVGNPGAVATLKKWLENWYDNYKRGFPHGNDAASSYRGVLLSGPPGVGKTTAAHLVARLLGFDVIETNASDARSKGALGAVTKSLQNQSLSGFLDLRNDRPSQESGVSGSGKALRPMCIIMDEVDGMSSGDRGGAAAMAAMIRGTKVPIILIANDASLPKMRVFDRDAFPIKFRRPTVDSLRRRLLTIAQVEGVSLDNAAVDQLVQATGGDMRQILTLLSTFATTSKSMSYDQGKKIGAEWKKVVVLQPFQIIGEYMSPSIWNRDSKYSFNDKIELYFNDPDMAPLMVQQNYLLSTSRLARSTKGGELALAAAAAESISDGDLVNSKIRGSVQQWSLMPLQGVLSCVRPSYLAAGTVRGRYEFSRWFGNNSTRNKYRRLMSEIKWHMRPSLWTVGDEVRLDYYQAIVESLLTPLSKNGVNGISDVIEFMESLYLTREDFGTFMELGVGPSDAKSVEARFKKVPTNVKSTLTRQYNKIERALPFVPSGVNLISKGRGVKGKVAIPGDEKVPVADEETEDLVEDIDEQQIETLDF